MSYLSPELSADDISNFFKIGHKPSVPKMPSAFSTIGGRKIDPNTGGSAEHRIDRLETPSYKRNPRSDNPLQQDYVRAIQEEEKEMMFDRYHRLQLGDQASTCGMSSKASTFSGYLEQLEQGSNLDGGSINFPEGMTQKQAIDVYKNYDFNKEYDARLPITRYNQEIVDTIAINQVTVIHGSTGSGKTTQVAQYILDDHAIRGEYCNVVVTQPRRIAAISVAKRVCDERGWRLGSVCGYQVGLDRCTSEDTRLTYCTTGVLLEMLVNKGHMRDFSHVILDEVHERDQDSDFCLLLVRMLLRKNSRDIKVVLMSATAESEKFARYFALPIRDVLEPAPVFNVSGRAYEIQEYYLEDLKTLCDWPLPELEVDKPGISNEAYDVAVRLIERFDNIESKQKSFGSAVPQRGSVLIFLPGLGQITDLEDRLNKHDFSKNHQLWVLPLHSTMTSAEQRRVFERPQPGMRKVILSTNIAESSITVSDVKYVIDFCLTKHLVCDTDTNFPSLQIQWASKSNCVQRMGRAGRVSDGRVYRFVTRDFYTRELPDHSTPEMLRCPLDILVLKAKLLNMGAPLAILGRALDPPLLDDIERTVLALKEVGALAMKVRGVPAAHDGDLTFTGRIMAKMPVSIQLTRLMLLGHVFGLLRDTVIIAACLSNKSFFSTPYRSSFMAFKKRLEWADFSMSDCIAFLNAYKTWEIKKLNNAFDNQLQEHAWHHTHFIQARRIREVQELVLELEKRLRREGVETPKLPPSRTAELAIPEEQRELLLKLLFCGAFYPNYFLQHKGDEEDVNKQMSGHSHTNTVQISGLPPNQGALYRRDVEQLFSDCISGDAPPVIHFEESKAFVEFPRDRDQRRGRVCNAVYLALKVRQLRIGMTLTLLDHDRALNLVQALCSAADRQTMFGVDTADEVGDGPRTGSSGTTEEGRPTSVLPPAARGISVFQIFVTDVVRCGHFWAHYGDEETHRNLQELRANINKDGGRKLCPLLATQIKVGALCLAPFPAAAGGDDHYYRARITNLFHLNNTQVQVQVFFVDYGNSEKLLSTSLMEHEKQYAKLPFQAFECELAHIKPSPLRCPTGNWSDAANQRFRALVEGAYDLYAQMYSVVHGVWRVVLHRSSTALSPGALSLLPGGSADTFSSSLNAQLVQENLADRAEESFLSKKSNKELTEQPVLSSQLARGDYDEIAPPQGGTPSGKPLRALGSRVAQRIPNKDDLNRNRGIARMRGNQIRLSGPWTAYEMRFLGLTRVSGFKEARIERDGVNSVSVDDEPADPHDRFLVAAFVGLNPGNDTIIVRDTTIMPKIPGLLAIMVLTFCPFAELRCDKQRTRYTGALCGLGIDPTTGQPAFPDHDMEIGFDFHFTEEDLGMINAVRIGIHVAIGNELSNMDYTPEAILKIQQKTREKLLRLVAARRDHVEKTACPRHYRWNLVAQDDLKQPLTKESLTEEDMPISLHCGIVLQPKEEAAESPDVTSQLEKLLEHIDYLHQQVKNRHLSRVLCGLCEITLNSCHELNLHLHTVQHKQCETEVRRAWAQSYGGV